MRACHCVCVCVCALCPSLGRTPRRCPPLPRALPPFSRRPPFSYIRVSPALTSESHIRVSPSLWAKLLFARAQGSPSRRDPWPPPGLPAGAARVPRRAPAPPILRRARTGASAGRRPSADGVATRSAGGGDASRYASSSPPWGWGLAPRLPAPPSPPSPPTPPPPNSATTARGANRGPTQEQASPPPPPPPARPP